jgi:hypothetical protein
MKLIAIIGQRGKRKAPLDRLFFFFTAMTSSRCVFTTCQPPSPFPRTYSFPIKFQLFFSLDSAVLHPMVAVVVMEEVVVVVTEEALRMEEALHMEEALVMEEVMAEVVLRMATMILEVLVCVNQTGRKNCRI